MLGRDGLDALELPGGWCVRVVKLTEIAPVGRAKGEAVGARGQHRRWTCADTAAQLPQGGQALAGRRHEPVQEHLGRKLGRRDLPAAEASLDELAGVGRRGLALHHQREPVPRQPRAELEAGIQHLLGGAHIAAAVNPHARHASPERGHGQLGARLVGSNMRRPVGLPARRLHQLRLRLQPAHPSSGWSDGPTATQRARRSFYFRARAK
eukprot:scaffold32910_cov86-Isochrysis_galbana.AAC.1